MNVSASCYGDYMEKHFRVWKGLGFTSARTKEDFFGFADVDVARLHFHKQGFGGRVFFRLRDGRVFDSTGQQHDPDPHWYDQTTH